MSAKQDAVYTRTAAALEQKINVKKRFSEVMGVATDARDTAKEAKNAVSELDGNLTSKEIFDRLTENGTLQGLYRDEQGNLYINANFIQAIEELFAKDIIMSGKFTQTTELFFEPEQEELETIQKHLQGTQVIAPANIPLYDFNNDGQITVADLSAVQMSIIGERSLANWSGAKKTTATMTINLSNPDKLLLVEGTNMWGRKVSKYIGLNYSNLGFKDIEGKVLWSGAWYMRDTQIITLPEPISMQPSGIVLVFSYYYNNTVQNHNFNTFFISKEEIELSGGCGRNFAMFRSGFENACNKYLYISDTQISGNETNDQSGTGSCGITYNNASFVLRYVIGV